MFESAEQEHSLAKEAFKAEEPKLREELLETQFDLVEKKQFPVLIVLTGIDGAGKGAALARLNKWLDTHTLRTIAFDRPTDVERARPPMWRYWLELPPKGTIGIFVGSWYRAPLTDQVTGADGADALARHAAAINRFEEMLADEGVLLLKFWLHLSRKDRRRRLKRAAQDKDVRHVLEHRSWKVTYETAIEAVQSMLQQTSTGAVPWIVVPSADPRYRDLTIGQVVLRAIRERLAEQKPAPAPSAPAIIPPLDRKTVLNALDLTQKLEPGEYRKELRRWQERLADLTDRKAFRDAAVVCVFEGNDAAGKGGSIRRVTMALDPRRFRVNPTAAPTDEEKAQPYLWRFWRRLPAKGHVAVFDRSWYGRVLVERVEGFCSEADWMRAYGEINDFEAQLDAFGFVVVKYWLAISSEEQLRRFNEREKTSFKRYKITDEDWRNRGKLDAYAQAVNDMVDRTSTVYAPWTLVEAEDKSFARVKVLRTLCERIEAIL